MSRAVAAGAWIPIVLAMQHKLRVLNRYERTYPVCERRAPL